MPICSGRFLNHMYHQFLKGVVGHDLRGDLIPAFVNDVSRIPFDMLVQEL